MREKFIRAAFCPPTGAWEGNLPSRLTDEVFCALKEVGINRIIGYGLDGRKETQRKILDFCEKYGIKYYPFLAVFEEYLREDSGKSGKAFCDLTEEEIKTLDARLITDVSEWTKEPAFGGIFFMDEKGYLSFPGMAHAKEVWDKHFSAWEFHFNFYSYSIDEHWFWGGQSAEKRKNVPFPLTGDLEIVFENRFRYYDKLVESLLSKAHFEFLSCDKYPFECFWREIPTSVHVGLFELNAFFAIKKKKYHSKFYNYMQVGTWEQNVPRKMTEAEMALQMHVTAAYGNEGFAYFPACFPLDWVGNVTQRQGAALVDIDGKPTEVWKWTKRLNTFFRTIEEDILNSDFLGTSEYGVYKNGFQEDDIRALPDQECIFRGKLPDLCRYKEKIEVYTTNCLMVSVFQRKNKKRYYLVNLSTVYGNEVSMILPHGKYEVFGVEMQFVTDEKIELTLNPGYGVYVKEL